MNFEEVRKIFKDKMKYHLGEGRNSDNEDDRKYHKISAISVTNFAYFSEIISSEEHDMYNKLIDRWIG